MPIDYGVFGDNPFKTSRKKSSQLKFDSYGRPIKEKPQREPVSRSQKNEVLARQKNKCTICKQPLDMRAVDFDHIKEVYKGGKSKVDNLQALCKNCHGKKTHKDRLTKVEKKRKTKKTTSKNLFGISEINLWE